MKQHGSFLLSSCFQPSSNRKFLEHRSAHHPNRYHQHHYLLQLFNPNAGGGTMYPHIFPIAIKMGLEVQNWQSVFGWSTGLVFWPVKIKKDQPGGQNWLKPGFIGQNWSKLEMDEITAKKWDLTITPTCMKVIYFPSMLIFFNVLFSLKILG